MSHALKIRLKKTIVFAVLFFAYMDMQLMAIIHTPPAVPYNSAIDTIDKSDEEWSQILSPEQYEILRKGGD